MCANEGLTMLIHIILSTEYIFRYKHLICVPSEEIYDNHDHPSLDLMEIIEHRLQILDQNDVENNEREDDFTLEKLVSYYILTIFRNL